MQNTSTDAKTAAYFNTHFHEYTEDRLSPFISVIEQYPGVAPSLIDVGCGVGNALDYLSAKTGLHSICALDVSELCVARTQQRLKCQAQVGSILDDALINNMAAQFDFALVAAVLHHLVSNSRRASKRMAHKALANVVKLVKPGGYVLLAEPVFAPAWAMDLVFYLKVAITRFTSERVGIFGYWNNIGAPVVSYYDCDQLRDLIGSIGGCAIVSSGVEKCEVPVVMRMAGIRDRSDATFVIQKSAGSSLRLAA